MNKWYFNTLWITLATLAICIALGSYVLKNHVMFLEQNLDVANKNIKDTLQEIHVLKIEFASLTRPDRINRLASEYLDMEAMTQKQFLSIYDIPYRGENL